MEKNILFLLTPKSQVAYVLDTYSIRQVIEKMNYHHFTAIPILNRKGQYVGTIGEGDLLWYIRDKYNLNFSQAEKDSVKNVTLRRNYKLVTVDVDINSLFGVALQQNFVPVSDDKGNFIGLVTRRTLLNTLLKDAGIDPDSIIIPDSKEEEKKG